MRVRVCVQPRSFFTAVAAEELADERIAEFVKLQVAGVR